MTTGAASRGVGSGASLAGADLLSLTSLDATTVASLYETAAATKAEPEAYLEALRGRTVILLFEKPSLRTRVTFEVGPSKMGAHAFYFDHSKERIGARESVTDYGKNLERWVDCVVARVFSHGVLEELAASASIPVVNALSDRFHPCQALADYFTLAERLGGVEKLAGFRLAYVGDGNNVCASLMHGAAILGVEMTVVVPEGYGPEASVMEECKALSRRGRPSIRVTHDPAEVRGSRAVYTDTWVSMGDEAEKVSRMAAFAAYRVDQRLMSRAGRNAWFMHCLPAHRGAEVTDAVIDSKRSLVYDQAENRMHVQNALLLHVLGRR
ncbi:MAG: ornithine carbamoyltransferase [Phycisphaerales bacterium]